MFFRIQISQKTTAIGSELEKKRRVRQLLRQLYTFFHRKERGMQLKLLSGFEGHEYSCVIAAVHSMRLGILWSYTLCSMSDQLMMDPDILSGRRYKMYTSISLDRTLYHPG